MVLIFLAECVDFIIKIFHNTTPPTATISAVTLIKNDSTTKSLVLIFIDTSLQVKKPISGKARQGNPNNTPLGDLVKFYRWELDSRQDSIIIGFNKRSQLIDFIIFIIINSK